MQVLDIFLEYITDNVKGIFLFQVVFFLYTVIFRWGATGSSCLYLKNVDFQKFYLKYLIKKTVGNQN